MYVLFVGVLKGVCIVCWSIKRCVLFVGVLKGVVYCLFSLLCWLEYSLLFHMRCWHSWWSSVVS